MVNKEHFVMDVIRPTLGILGMNGKQAEVLLLGTALAESGLSALKQYNNGPALGVYQMEPFTHFDIWENYLKYRKNLIRKMYRFMAPGFLGPEQLIGNLYYATAMARIHYRRVKSALPLVDDILGMSNYHKTHYNTHLGKANVEENTGYFKKAMEIIL